jgi:hypothetical protein
MKGSVKGFSGGKNGTTLLSSSRFTRDRTNTREGCSYATDIFGKFGSTCVSTVASPINI